MKGKNVILTAVLALLLLLAAAGIWLWLWQGGYQYASIKGYSLSVPSDWTMETEENTLIFSHKGRETGRFSLLYQDCPLREIPASFGYQGAVPSVRESDQYDVKVYELSFQSDDGDILQYVFDALPSMPPYKLVLTLLDGNDKLARRILAGITLPVIDGFAPEKPVTVPVGEALEQTVYTIQNQYGFFSYNLSRLESLLADNGQPMSNEDLSILTFVSDEGERRVKTWYHLAFDGETQYLFTYYQDADGQYIYDNNPAVIKQITKTVSPEENYTRYLADGLVILETPYNQYTEHRDALLQYKGTLIGDNSNVHGLVMEALPAGIVLEGMELETEQDPYSLVLQYTLSKDDQYVKDGVLQEAPFYQNALVLFSLIDNVDCIQMDIQGIGGKHQVAYYRQTAEQQFENQDLRGFASDRETFGRFAEDVPKIEPPSEKGSGNKTDGTRAIYSTTVTVSSGAVVKHPKTGRMVSVVPYAERYGVSQYLDKPITVTLYEKVESGETVMWAAASCGGATLGTYPISSRAEFENLLSMVP